MFHSHCDILVYKIHIEKKNYYGTEVVFSFYETNFLENQFLH